MPDLVRISVKLSPDEAKELFELAEDECRQPPEQARKLIRDGLREAESDKKKSQVSGAA